MSDVDEVIKTFYEFCDKIGKRVDTRIQLYRRLQDAFGQPNTDNWWRYREASRFVHLQYEPILPDDDEWSRNITEHSTFLEAWPHRAKGDPNLISWTPSPEYGMNDRRVVGKPGRLLTSRWRLTDEALVASLVNRFNIDAKPVELRYATTVDQIVWVYRNGPTSCMSKAFPLDANPVVPYACPSLRVAYLWQPHSSRIVARTLLRTDRNEYTRIYGNEFAMMKYMRNNGFVLGPDGLVGVQLGQPHADVMNNRLWVPYIDLPHQHLCLDFAEQTMTVVRSDYVCDRTKQIVMGATDAAGRLQLSTSLMRAWINKDPSLLIAKPSPSPGLSFRTRPRPRPLDEVFWGGYNQHDENGNIECSDCEDFYERDDVSADYAGRPVCQGCLDDHYVSARNVDGADVMVHNDDDHLHYVECIGEYCVGIDPSEVFEVVELLSSGDYCRTQDAIYSELMEGYLHSDEAQAITLRNHEGGEESDYATSEFLAENEERVLYVWSEHGSRRYPLDSPAVYYITDGANLDEQRQALLAQTEGQAGEANETIRIQTGEELVTYVAAAISDNLSAHRHNRASEQINSRYLPATAYLSADFTARIRDRVESAQRAAAAA